MAFSAKLSFTDSGGGPDSSFKVLSCGFGFNQNTDYTGRPSGKVTINNISLTVESTKDTQLADWMINTSTKNGSIEFNIQDGERKLLEFEDAYCVQYSETFTHEGESPMSITISFTAKKVVLDQVVEIDLFEMP